ncbi:ABC transporter permease [Luminiphilus sp.]|jgi:lipoprotein-releasing system permease protein|nr:ABC transporter permease [Luminiphilus sp.]MDB2377854.1 ABC transporter permease [Luminiphilus sp.]MDB2511896.1 ABC transporter permease [Luminiphilus sp.]MDB2691886.1 ABC transporter permease [Luminiphilus sp.]MDB3899230.1 ABC transporter permease [Luminiphilus sp.]
MRWPTRFHWEIAARQALDPGLGLSAFLSKLSIVGMLIAVSLLLAALSVMNGFEREMRVRILNLVPHVTVRGFALDREWQQVADELGQSESVMRHSPFSDIDALFTIRGEARVVRLIIADSSALNGLEGYITPTSERISSDELILGGSLAEELNLRVGDVVSVLLSGGAGRKTLIPRNLKLVATLNSETEIDRYFAFSGQGMNTTRALANKAHAITLSDPLQARVFAAALRQSLSSQFWVSDWTESQGNLYQAIQLSRQIVSLMLASLLLIAIFNVVTSLVLVASDRSASSAMLRAMGASRGDISTIFVIQGTIIGVGGATLGAVLGVVLALSAPYLVSLVESLQGAALLDTRVYPLAYVPVDLRLRDFILVPSLAFVLSVISCAVPAISASRLPISQGLMQSR